MVGLKYFRRNFKAFVIYRRIKLHQFIRNQIKGVMPQENHPSAKGLWWRLSVCVLLILTTFLIDLSTPLGIAGGVPYIVPVLLSAGLPKRFPLFLVSGICSLLTIAGFLFAQDLDALNLKVLTNRSLALFAIWVTAILSYLQYKYWDQREQALNRVRILEGILPICMDCRKIRDQSNQWKNIETYIAEHSEAKFSHGYCPDCGTQNLKRIRKTLQRAN